MTNSFRCVIDVSVGIKQFVPDPLTAKVNELFACLAYPEVEFFVPDLFYIESGNTLWKYVRAGLYAAADVPADLASLKALCLTSISTSELVEEAVAIALAYGITAYDASYVALSKRVSAPFLTLDRKLFNALATATYDLRLFSDFSIPSLP